MKDCDGKKSVLAIWNFYSLKIYKICYNQVISFFWPGRILYNFDFKYKF